MKSYIEMEESKESDNLPLTGLKVIEFTHAVMGPSCGLLLGDMGADVIHIEPVEGNLTRSLKSFGIGLWDMYFRNKKSLAIDIKSAEGKEIINRLIRKSDILVENFGPGTIDRLGWSYDLVKQMNPRLIYCSLKGFLSGPYEKRHAMDELIQMMGGLSYMTGRPGDPIRVGTSIIDITGGLFGYIGILQALYEREKTKKGKYIKSALFESCVFLMGQNMAFSSYLPDGETVQPLPTMNAPWSVYRTFKSADDKIVFIGIVSDKHWERFCYFFDWIDWLNNNDLKLNKDRILNTSWLHPSIQERISKFTKSEILSRCEDAEIPFAPISKPEDLFNDPHLIASNALLPVNSNDGKSLKLPKTPLQYGDCIVNKYLDPPKIGEHSREILAEIGYNSDEIELLGATGIVGLHKKLKIS